MDNHDRFSVIDTEAGTISPSQLATLTSTSLLVNDMEEGTDVFMTPADEPILICSLPQPVPEPVKEAPPPEIKNVKKEGGSRRKSKRIQLRSSADSDKGTEAGPATRATSPAPGTRMLPATLREAKREAIAKDPSGKVGSCAENPTSAGRSYVTVEKDKDPSGKAGSCGGNPTPAAQIPIKNERVEDPSGKAPHCSVNPVGTVQRPTTQKPVEGPSRKAPPCSVNPPAMDQNPMVIVKEKEKEKEKGPEKAKAMELEREKRNLLDAVYGSSTSNPLPPPAMNLLDALKLLSKPDNKYEDVDILDICAMKGIHFDPPRWHRPGGYNRKPKPTDKDFLGQKL